MRQWIATVAAFALTIGVAFADDTLPVPPVARVTDTTNTLSADQKQQLEAKLTDVEQRKGSQIAILIIPTTQPEDIESYSYRVADSWKLGRKGVDDGVLLTVAKNDHRVRIEVGRGLEGAIPDAATARIIREYVTPKFRSGDFFGGVNDAVDALTKLIDGEPLPPPLEGKQKPQHNDVLGSLMTAFFLTIFARLYLGGLPVGPRAVLVAIAGAAAGSFFSGVMAVTVAMGVLGLILGLAGGTAKNFTQRGGWGGWTGGGGGGGFSGGGGGFSGGGGGFAGGGASGSW